MNLQRLFTGFALIAALAAGKVDAGFTTFFGDELETNTNGAGNMGRVDVTVMPNDVADAYNSFITALGAADIGVEDFELKDRGAEFDGVAPTNSPASPISLDLRFDRISPETGSLPITAQMDGVAQIAKLEDTSANSAGRYPIPIPVGGTQYADTNYVTLDLVFDFDNPIIGFGMFATDVGDFEGDLRLLVTDINDVTTELNIPHQSLINDFGDTANALNGSVLFFGFTSDVAFTKVEFMNADGVLDRFGFDNIVVGVANEVPEPSSLALLATGFAGVLFRRRLQRRANVS